MLGMLVYLNQRLLNERMMHINGCLPSQDPWGLYHNLDSESQLDYFKWGRRERRKGNITFVSTMPGTWMYIISANLILKWKIPSEQTSPHKGETPTLSGAHTEGL